jgi:hypothetical protein
LTNVNDVAGDHTGAISAQMGILLGDTNGNRSVNSTDVTQTKGQSGRAITSANFRQDVNMTGSINASDISLVKSKSGDALPDLSQILKQRPQQIAPTHQQSAFSVRK